MRMLARAVSSPDGAKRGALHIYDAIGGGQMIPLFGGGGVSAGSIQKAIASLQSEGAGDLDVHIHSPGGDVFDGMAIHAAIKSWAGGKRRVYIDGLAASIASIIAMAGDEIYIAPHAMMMIHAPRCNAQGDAEEMLKAAERLETMSNVMAECYSAKCGKSKDEVIALMKAETWMTAEQAVAMGFADAVALNVDGEEDDEEDEEYEARFRAVASAVFSAAPESAQRLFHPHAYDPDQDRDEGGRFASGGGGGGGGGKDEKGGGAGDKSSKEKESKSESKLDKAQKHYQKAEKLREKENKALENAEHDKADKYRKQADAEDAKGSKLEEEHEKESALKDKELDDRVKSEIASNARSERLARTRSEINSTRSDAAKARESGDKSTADSLERRADYLEETAQRFEKAEKEDAEREGKIQEQYQKADSLREKSTKALEDGDHEKSAEFEKQANEAEKEGQRLEVEQEQSRNREVLSIQSELFRKASEAGDRARRAEQKGDTQQAEEYKREADAYTRNALEFGKNKESAKPEAPKEAPPKEVEAPAKDDSAFGTGSRGKNGKHDEKAKELRAKEQSFRDDKKKAKAAATANQASAYEKSRDAFKSSDEAKDDESHEKAASVHREAELRHRDLATDKRVPAADRSEHVRQAEEHKYQREKHEKAAGIHPDFEKPKAQADIGAMVASFVAQSMQAISGPLGAAKETEMTEEELKALTEKIQKEVTERMTAQYAGSIQAQADFLNVTGAANPAEAVAKVAAMKIKADRADELAAQLAKVEESNKAATITAMLDAAVKDGRLPPAKRAELSGSAAPAFAQDVSTLKAFLDYLPVQVKRTEEPATPGTPPPAQLTEDEMSCASQLGLKAESVVQFKQKK